MTLRYKQSSRLCSQKKFQDCRDRFPLQDSVTCWHWEVW